MNKIDNIENFEKIFFIGIGGIGISAAARILNKMGKQVSGSDISESEITVQLEKEGINVFISQKSDNVSLDTDLVVYTVAIEDNNPERQRANDLGIPQITYPQLLGLLMKGKIGIGISGTDGKTTTTAMLGKIFRDADLDPTIVIGSKVSYLGGNSCVGDGKFFIFEGDEYKRAFYNYYPFVVGLTNIRADHLDVYKDLDVIKNSFIKYFKNISSEGRLVINNDDSNCLDVVLGNTRETITYAIDSEADVVADNIRYEHGKQKFNIVLKNKNLGEIEIVMPGKYNVYNSLLAIAIALDRGIKFEVIRESLRSFQGVWRRFEKLGTYSDTEIITDYAHTPEGLSQVIKAAKELYSNRRILFVFQPHQYNRTKAFKDDFIKSLKNNDNVILSDIFYVQGRENPNDFNVSSLEIAKEANVEYGGDLNKTEELVRDKINNFEVVIFIGAGNVYNLAKKFI